MGAAAIKVEHIPSNSPSPSIILNSARLYFGRRVWGGREAAQESEKKDIGSRHVLSCFVELAIIYATPEILSSTSSTWHYHFDIGRWDVHSHLKAVAVGVLFNVQGTGLLQNSSAHHKAKLHTRVGHTKRNVLSGL